MKKICFVTGTRSDYGIMAPVIRKIKESGDTELQVIATNMHLSPEFGMTVNEIEADGIDVSFRIESLVSGNTSASTVLSMAKVQEGLAEAYKHLNPDLVVILGDRYEALAAASAAVAFNIPIAHLHGGETTEGAIDNKFRHAITQLSDYHFASTPQYVEKIISMGIDPERVYHSGAPGAEVKETDSEAEYVEMQEFAEKTGIMPGEAFILLAFHPVTLSPDKGESELKATLEALDTFINQGYKILVTMPNSDPGHQTVKQNLEDWAKKHSGSVVYVKSLGSRLFHHALDNALAMVGNSSAALIEAPSHRLGAVNVGERQRGRVHGITVMDSPGEARSIVNALNAVLSMEMKAVLMGMPVTTLNPYYKEDSASYIAEKLLKSDTSELC